MLHLYYLRGETKVFNDAEDIPEGTTLLFTVLLSYVLVTLSRELLEASTQLCETCPFKVL